MTAAGRRGRAAGRIVVALNAHKQSLAALEIASALASRLNAEIEALFVEDEELVHVADLPFALEVDRISGATRRLDAGLMARVLRTEATLLRRLLARATATLPTSPRLRVVRGRYLPEALTVAAGADVTILHRARRSLAEQAGRAPAVRRHRKPLWVVFDGGPESERALEIAAELSRLLGRELGVMLLCEREEQAKDVERNVRALCAESAVEARSVVVPSARTEDLRRAIGRQGAELLVLGRSTAELEDGIAAWLEETGIPVMLVA